MTASTDMMLQLGTDIRQIPAEDSSQLQEQISPLRAPAPAAVATAHFFPLRFERSSL